MDTQILLTLNETENTIVNKHAAKWKLSKQNTIKRIIQSLDGANETI